MPMNHDISISTAVLGYVREVTKQWNTYHLTNDEAIDDIKNALKLLDKGDDQDDE
jgi:hypothetical protein